jgi:hypothetical protein
MNALAIAVPALGQIKVRCIDRGVATGCLSPARGAQKSYVVQHGWSGCHMEANHAAADDD